MTNCSCVQTFLSSSVQHWCLVSLLYSEKFTPVHSPEVSPFTKWDHPMEQIKCFSVSWWPKMSIFLRNYSEFNSIFFIFLYLYLWPTQWGYILFFFVVCFFVIIRGSFTYLAYWCMLFFDQPEFLLGSTIFCWVNKIIHGIFFFFLNKKEI